MGHNKKNIIREKTENLLKGGFGDGIDIADIAMKYKDKLDEKGFYSHEEKHEMVEEMVKEGIKNELEHIGDRSYNDEEINNFLNNKIEDLTDYDIGVLQVAKEIAIDHIYGEGLEYYNYLEKAKEHIEEGNEQKGKFNNDNSNISSRMKELIGQKENPRKKRFFNENFKQKNGKATFLKEEAQKLNDKLGEVFGEETKEDIIDAIEKNGIVEEGVDKSMREINDILGGYGVEAIYAYNSWKAYWMDTVAIYVNIGEIDHPTVLYDTVEEEFKVTTINDFIEESESEGYEIK